MWTTCPQDARAQCATVRVPVDYSDPAGDTIDLAIDKVSASGEKQGVLLVNPGGPGVEGRSMAVAAAERFPALRAHHDVIGFDPRGVNASGQIVCLDAAERDAFLAAGLEPPGPAGDADRRRAAASMAAACASKVGGRLAHLGTVDVARDLDVVRAALGESKIDYLGVSYGTLIGQYYAERFPSRVGRMYLDSVMDPSAGIPELITAGASAAQLAYERFLEHCVAKGACPLGASVLIADAKIKALVAESDAHGSTPPVREGLHAVMDPPLWPELTDLLAASESGDVGRARRLAQTMPALPPATLAGVVSGLVSGVESGHTSSGVSSTASSVGPNLLTNSQPPALLPHLLIESFLSVVCLFATPADRGNEVLDAAIKTATAISPLFGTEDNFRPCAYWPVTSEVTAHAIHPDGLPPVLFTNNTDDPRTPLLWAVDAQSDFPGSVLAVNVGDGHGVAGLGTCTDGLMTDFLDAGQLPGSGIVCHDNPLI